MNLVVMLTTFSFWKFCKYLKGILVELFVCYVCTASTGTGKSKKLAKRQAAHKMWEKLQDSPMTASSAIPGLDEDDEVCAGIRSSPLVCIVKHL
jgi:hypothetical protein